MKQVSALKKIISKIVFLKIDFERLTRAEIKNRLELLLEEWEQYQQKETTKESK